MFLHVEDLSDFIHAMSVYVDSVWYKRLIANVWYKCFVSIAILNVWSKKHAMPCTLVSFDFGLESMIDRPEDDEESFE